MLPLDLPEQVHLGEDGRWHKPCSSCGKDQSYLRRNYAILSFQEFKCALTGWDIDAKNVAKNTASLDRIDSSIGYVEGNVQWVHKMVNMCKQQYTQEEFLSMCDAVSNKIKW